MRNCKFEIAIGDEVFEASKMYNKVIGWKITDIKLEKYVAGWKAIVRLENTYNFVGCTTKFLSDVLYMYETKEDAEKALKGETVQTIDDISTLRQRTMTEHKFTDEEIIKTLRGCIGALQCEDCPYMEVANCANQHITDAVDLLKRHREELAVLRKKKVCSVGDKLYIIVPGGGKDGGDGIEINHVTDVGERFIFFSGSYPPEDDILNNVEISDLGKEVFLDEAAFKQELERRRLEYDRGRGAGGV